MHAFIVEAAIAVDPFPGPGIPPTQTFTLVLDADRRSALFGAPNGQGALSFDPAAGQQTVGQQQTNGLGAKASFSYGCSNSLGIDQLTLAIDASGRLTGSGTGWVSWAITDILHMGAARLTLTGHADRETPVLAPATGSESDDPLSPFSLIASEPLPNDVYPVLVSQTGERTTLGPPVGSPPGPAQWAFAIPRTSLRYGETYRVTTDGIADFEGNAATADFHFTTRAPPPLIPEDGFESATGDVPGGGMLIAGEGAPVIAGTKSVYLPTGGSFGPPRGYTTMAVRLALKPGDKAVRFSYRSVTAYSAYYWTATFGIASPGGTIAWVTLPARNTATTPITIAGLGSLQATPVATAELLLPPDAADEVVFARFVSAGSCGGPPVPLSGIIMDDLRAE